MAPNLIIRATTLFSILITASATLLVCTENVSSPANTFCGLPASISNFDFYIKDLTDTEYLTPEGCAQACAVTSGCLSFQVGTIDGTAFCELEMGTTTQTGAVSDDTSTYQAYDLACFACVALPVSTTSSTSSSSSSLDVTTSSSTISTAATSSSVASTTSSSLSSSIASSTSSASLTTETITTTIVSTISSCAPTVTNCPYGMVVTNTIVSLTTYCPVLDASAAVATVSPATPIGGAKPSTIYSTKTYTITACPATVTNCPIGKVTTTVIPFSTKMVPSISPFTNSTAVGGTPVITMTIATSKSASGSSSSASAKSSSPLVVSSVAAINSTTSSSRPAATTAGTLVYSGAGNRNFATGSVFLLGLAVALL